MPLSLALHGLLAAALWLIASQPPLGAHRARAATLRFAFATLPEPSPTTIEETELEPEALEEPPEVFEEPRIFEQELPPSWEEEPPPPTLQESLIDPRTERELWSTQIRARDLHRMNPPPPVTPPPPASPPADPRDSVLAEGESEVDEQLSGDEQPLLLEAPPPLYPPRAARLHWEGSVICRIKVGSDGRVLEVEIVQSSGHASLDEAARRAILDWRFRPARKGQEAVQAEILHRITFQISAPS